MKISNLKIGTRLGLGFGILLLLQVASIWLGLNDMAAIHNSLLNITDKNNVTMGAAAHMRVAQMQVTMRQAMSPC